MSSAAVIACDGCGATAVQPTINGRTGVYPAGWIRLSTTGRPTGETTSINLGRFDVCSPECAPKALEATAERVRPPDGQ